VAIVVNRLVIGKLVRIDIRNLGCREEKELAENTLRFPNYILDAEISNIRPWKMTWFLLGRRMGSDPGAS
jgi:hypothetical protein